MEALPVFDAAQVSKYRVKAIKAIEFDRQGNLTWITIAWEDAWEPVTAVDHLEAFADYVRGQAELDATIGKEEPANLQTHIANLADYQMPLLNGEQIQVELVLLENPEIAQAVEDLTIDAIDDLLLMNGIITEEERKLLRFATQHQQEGADVATVQAPGPSSVELPAADEPEVVQGRPAMAFGEVLRFTSVHVDEKNEQYFLVQWRDQRVSIQRLYRDVDLRNLVLDHVCTQLRVGRQRQGSTAEQRKHLRTVLKRYHRLNLRLVARH